MARWFFIALGTVLCILGLLAASRSGDVGFYIHGLLIASLGVGLVFWLVGSWPLEGAEQ